MLRLTSNLLSMRCNTQRNGQQLSLWRYDEIEEIGRPSVDVVTSEFAVFIDDISVSDILANVRQEVDLVNDRNLDSLSEDRGDGRCQVGREAKAVDLVASFIHSYRVRQRGGGVLGLLWGVGRTGEV